MLQAVPAFLPDPASVCTPLLRQSSRKAPAHPTYYSFFITRCIPESNGYPAHQHGAPAPLGCAQGGVSLPNPNGAMFTTPTDLLRGVVENIL